MTPTPIPEDFEEMMWEASTCHGSHVDHGYLEHAEEDFCAGAKWARNRVTVQGRCSWNGRDRFGIRSSSRVRRSL